VNCDECDNAERQPAVRSRLAERDGHTAIVLGVPVEECPACGQVWLTMETAVRLDELFNQLLSSGAEMAQIHWDAVRAA
jgi:YgiT-type zinc finger domain-containing protein